MPGCRLGTFLSSLRKACCAAIIFMAWTAGGQDALAHPISLSSAIINVESQVIHVEMEIMLEDLVLYHQLQADGESRYSASDLKKAAQAHRQFVLDYFSILDQDGRRLSGEITAEDLEQIQPAGVLQSDLMSYTLRYNIDYPLLRPKPEFLTFSQNFGGPKVILPAVMDISILQDEVIVEPPNQLSQGRPHTIQMAWDKAALSNLGTLAELRRKRADQFRQRLGIATYTGLYSFLYLNRYEVRHEILIPLITLEQWLPIARGEPDFLTVPEQEAARDAIEKFFQERNTLRLDGQLIPARLARLNFFGLNINDFALNADPRKVSIHQARVGVILSFPCPRSPREIDLRWDVFSDHAPFLRSVVLVENEPPVEHYFREKEPEFHWSGQLRTPQVQLVKAASASLPDSEVKEIVEGLLLNIYRAFDFRDDEDIYDALATSAHGPMLRELYLRIKKSLLVAEQGGSLSRVSKVEVQEIVREKRSSHRELLVVWRATGTTEHWGHIHTRTTEYRARLGLEALDNAWKLTRFQLLDEKQREFATSIRGYNP